MVCYTREGSADSGIHWDWKLPDLSAQLLKNVLLPETLSGRIIGVHQVLCVDSKASHGIADAITLK